MILKNKELKKLQEATFNYITSQTFLAEILH